MTLSVYNTLSRRQEPFETVEPGKVKMYYCGVTVYDYCHLGHARACIVWDVVRRYLEFIGYEVRYVQNFTDVDDKILNRARQEHSTMETIADRFIKAYFEDMARLNVKEASEYPRATHTMNGITRLIHELENKGYAYASKGDVYYAVRSFPEYGKLSGRKLENSQAGASGRVDLEDPEYQRKKDSVDFALWKAAKPDEPAWESPWGKGRPGWHIECSAMVRDRLGETIDIHAGGEDLIFPHHENEIAQSEAVTGKPLSRYWMHNGMVKVDGEKMSKSLGNFTTIRDLLDRGVDPMAVRLFVLMAQYRTPIDFTDEAIQAATNGWHTLKKGLLFGYQYGEKLGWGLLGDSLETGGQGGQGGRLGDNSFSPSPTPPLPTFVQTRLIASLLPETVERFQEAVNNDFNFPGGLIVLFELAKELHREGNIFVHEGKTEISPLELLKQWHTLLRLAGVLGLEAEMKAEKSVSDGLSDAEIEAKIHQRQDARIAKNFVLSDRIRDELLQYGITLIDSRDGTRWHRN